MNKTRLGSVGISKHEFKVSAGPSLEITFLEQPGNVVYSALYIFTCNASLLNNFGRRGGLMVNARDSRSSGLGSSPGRGHCVVFLDKTLNSHSASLHPGVGEWVPASLMLGLTM